MIMGEVKPYTDVPRRLSLDEMKQFLWGAAVRLRGQIDAAGYKEYIFPLLFFKRISDVFDEQYSGYVAEGGAEYANSQVEDFAIRIPDEAHWRDVRAVTENVGQRLVEAFIAIEQANPGVRTDGRIVGGLEGIFGPKDIWTNKNKMPDHIITSLIEDFSQHNLSLASCPADEMGQAYEYLIGKFADDAGNTAQEFYTNRTVVTLMAEILKPQPGESIYDPTCGSGGMLVKCLDYLREKEESWQSVKVFGQEINALTSSIARMNLYLNGVEDFSIVREDTLKNPAFVDGSHLRTFDVVLANPPYSIKAWDRDAFANDKWGRNFLGTPPQGRADYAFLQHIIASMNPKSGRCAILFPHGVLFRKEEKDMRESLIKSDKIEAVIGLGPNLFYNSPMEACIIICNNNKPENRRGKILMINAVNEVVRKNAESYLEESHINRILQAFNGDAEIEGFSSLVSNEVIIEKNSDLTISLYAYSSSLNVVTLGDENPQGDWSEIRRSLWNTLSPLANSLGCILDINDFYPVSSHMVSSLKMFTLEDVADEVKQTWRKDTENVPVVGLEHIIPGEIALTQYDINPNENTFTKKFEKGQILLGRRRVYQKKACVAPFDGICSGDITTIQAKVVDNFEPGLLPFIIQNDRFFDYAVQGSAGSLSPRVKWEYLKRYSFLLPESIEDQRALAEKLRAAYRLKEAYKRLLSAIDEMVKSQFLEMFDFEDLTLSNPSNNFSKKCYDDTSSATKVAASDYQKSGRYAIYDQSQDCNIAGYTDSEEGLCDNYPAVLFGDHSRVVKYINRPFYIGADGVKVIRPKEEDLLPEFLYYDLLYHNIPNTGYNRHFKYVKMLRLTEATIDKQKQFLQIARQADKSKFDGFKSQFIEMFGTLTNPKFEVKNLGNCCDVERGGSPRPISEYITDSPEGINWIKIGDADEGMYITSTKEKILTSGIKKSRMVFKGDLLLSNSMSFGRPYILNIDGCIHDGWLVLHFDKALFNSEYLCSYLSQQSTYTELAKLADGAVVSNLNKEIVKILPVIAPPMALQEEFTAVVRQSDKSKYYEINET